VVAALLGAQSLPASAESWNIGIAGAWGTGYVGFFARHGMPRERVLDSQLSDIDLLRRYPLIVVSGGVNGWQTALPAIEEYVRGGGCAILECAAYPSPEVLPGTRIKPQAGPNFVIEAAGHPALGNIPQGKTYTHNGYSSAAIVPQGGQATVLARFTEEGASDKVRGHFVDGGQSVPAIVHLPLGKGQLIYSGPWIGYGLAFGRDYQDLVFALVRHLTGGHVVPRLTLAGPDNLLIGRPWGPPIPAQTASEVTDTALPEGYTALENLSGGFEEYDVTGAIGGGVDVLLDYRGPSRCHAVRVDPGGQLRITAAGEQGEAEIAAAKSDAKGELIVARRRGAIRVLIDGRRVLEAADRGQWGGLVACRGLGDPAVQPVADVQFADDFMRKSGEAGDWQPVSGKWQVISTEGSPDTGANPFSYGIETEGPAIATAGDWFWDDYEAHISARWTQNAAGLIFHYRDAQNYELLEADLAEKKVHLVRVAGGERTVLESVPADLRPWQWYRLGIKASRGLAIASLDGRQIVESFDPHGGCGPIGLYARGTKAAFDDVEAQDWRALSPRDSGEPALWRALDGACESLKEGGLAVQGLARGPERLGDVAATAEVRLAKAQRAGFRLRDADGRACAVVLADGGEGMVLKLLQLQDGGDAKALESVSLRGSKPGDWQKLSVKAVRDRIFCAIDDKPMFVRAAEMPAEGWVSLLGEGKGPAHFRSVEVLPADSDLRCADPPTPAYAGVVDVMTWAGPSFSWSPDPSDLPLFWHDGETPGNLRLKVGVHKGGAPKAVAETVLAQADGVGAESTVARFEHEWGKPEVAVSVHRGGKTLAEGAYKGAIPENGFLAEVERAAGTLALRVDGTPALTYNEPRGAVDGARVGVRLEGSTLCYDDLVLEAASVRDYSFVQAPTDWLVQLGTWEVTSRWTCEPQWTWLSGVAPRYAMVQSKWQVEGDVEMDVHVGAKMLQTPAGRKEVLQELRLGVCGQPGYLNAGYFFLIGSRGGKWTALQRNGLIVAERDDFQLPQASVHNDWLKLGVVKRGGEVSLLCHGQPVLSYTDPDPLPGGTVCIGTYDNGIMVPRVTVYGMGQGERRG
jgi:hypothetical protein